MYFRDLKDHFGVQKEILRVIEPFRGEKDHFCGPKGQFRVLKDEFWGPLGQF